LNAFLKCTFKFGEGLFIVKTTADYSDAKMVE